jgi:uncharacterized RDD family membrane protein YckC
MRFLSSQRVRPAGFISRFIAFSIDVVIISLTTALAVFLVNEIIAFFRIDVLITRWLGNIADTTTIEFVLRVLVILLNQIYTILYFAVFWSLIGYTPGKYVVKLRVVRVDGLRLGFWRSVLRAVCYYLSALLLFLGFVWIIFDKNRQGLHDKIANTVVIYS